MTYKEKLLDPRWQKKRLEILERDNWACQNCSDDKATLHVHHILYEKNKEPWDIENYWLTTLCEKCHLLEEYIKKKDYYFLEVLKKEFNGTTVIICLMTNREELCWGLFNINDNKTIEETIIPFELFQNMVQINYSRETKLKIFREQNG